MDGEALKARVDLIEQMSMRAVRVCLQLQAWRERGYAPQLHSGPEGWVLVLDTTKWGLAEPSERAGRELIRYCTAPCETPEATVEAALKVIQP